MAEVQVLRIGHLTPEEYRSVWQEIEEQTDRGAAITAGAFVDEHLTWAIKTRFVNLPKSTADWLFRGAGPLATFKAKTEIGVAIGLYDEFVRSELSAIAIIRNKFAHSMRQMNFKDEQITDRCQQLKIPAMRSKKRRLFDPRQQFIFTCRVLMAAIVVEASLKEKLIGPNENSVAAWVEAFESAQR